jgi:hypothetical protein
MTKLIRAHIPGQQGSGTLGTLSVAAALLALFDEPPVEA